MTDLFETIAAPDADASHTSPARPRAIDRVHFVVPGEPVAKGRPIAGRGFSGRITMRTPAKTVGYESTVRLFASQAMADTPPFAGPVRLDLDICLRIPASWSKKRQLAALIGDIEATKKPDCSNVQKAIEDAMNGVVYGDDAQITEIRVVKRYASIPGVSVVVERINKEGA